MSSAGKEWFDVGVRESGKPQPMVAMSQHGKYSKLEHVKETLKVHEKFATEQLSHES